MITYFYILVKLTCLQFIMYTGTVCSTESCSPFVFKYDDKLMSLVHKYLI